MKFNPFEAVGDYPKMLNKIAFFTFFVAIICTTLLRKYIPGFEGLCAYLNYKPEIKIFEINIPFATAAIAFLVALLFRIIKFHDRISDLLSIRKKFDMAHIIYPLAMLSESTISESRLNYIIQNRGDVMYAVFYKYASSSDDKASVDKHLIKMVMDQWSWYWIIVEANSLFLITSIILFSHKDYFISSVLFIIIFVLLILLIPIQHYCVRYARAEVRDILAETTRVQEIRKFFNAL